MTYDRYETMLKLCHAMEWAVDAEAVYQRLVNVVSECFGCDASNLHLLDTEGKMLVRHAAYDTQSVEGRQASPLTLGMVRMACVVEDRNVVITDCDHPHADDEFPETMLEAGFKNVATIPLVSSSGVVGILTLVYLEAQSWTGDDEVFLLEIGCVLGTFIQRLQGAKKELELRILRERKQLSGEIHDTLSQMVSALAVRADIAKSCHKDGDGRALAVELDRLSRQARDVTKMLRGEMVSLCAPMDEMSSVRDGVAGCLSRFEAQWGIKTRLLADGAENLTVSEHVGLQLARIVNECLQNVLRHSHASSVLVLIEGGEGRVIVTVRDDGDGFDVDSVAPERLGIRIMHERAAAAGGSLAIVSGPQGTTVLIELPTA